MSQCQAFILYGLTLQNDILFILSLLLFLSDIFWAIVPPEFDRNSQKSIACFGRREKALFSTSLSSYGRSIRLDFGWLFDIQKLFSYSQTSG